MIISFKFGGPGIACAHMRISARRRHAVLVLAFDLQLPNIPIVDICARVYIGDASGFGIAIDDLNSRTRLREPEMNRKPCG